VKTDSIKTQSGQLPERHKAHLSWPPIVTKNNNTKPVYCKVQGAKGTNVHKSVMLVHTVVNKNTIHPTHRGTSRWSALSHCQWMHAGADCVTLCGKQTFGRNVMRDTLMWPWGVRCRGGWSGQA